MDSYKKKFDCNSSFIFKIIYMYDLGTRWRVGRSPLNVAAAGQLPDRCGWRYCGAGCPSKLVSADYYYVDWVVGAAALLLHQLQILFAKLINKLYNKL